MKSSIQTIIEYYKSNELVLDSNLLILFLVGSFNKDIIEKFKRTNKYVRNDFTVLVKFISFFQRIIATPNILTEVCNLCLSYNISSKNKLYPVFHTLISELNESYIPTKEVSSLPSFPFLGVSDTAIIKLCEKGHLLLTDDFELYAFMSKNDMPVVNFNHIRSFDE